MRVREYREDKSESLFLIVYFSTVHEVCFSCQPSKFKIKTFLPREGGMGGGEDRERVRGRMNENWGFVWLALIFLLF